MSVENFIWDKQNKTITWTYNEKTIKQTYENLLFACFNSKYNCILVEVGKFKLEQFYYLSYDGKQIFIYDNANDKVRWQYNNKMIEADCTNIENALIYFNHEIVLVITVINQKEKRLKGFALDGTLLFDKEPPPGYRFEYLSMSLNNPTVVCDGGKLNEDAYGRSSYHFKIDTKSGNMTKGSLSYN